MRRFYDTSALLDTIDEDALLNKYQIGYVVPAVVEELEELKYKYSNDPGRLYKVRVALRTIKNGYAKVVYPNNFLVRLFIKRHNLPDNRDSQIFVGSLLHNAGASFVTGDLAQYLLATHYFHNNDIDYIGIGSEYANCEVPQLAKEEYTGHCVIKASAPYTSSVDPQSLDLVINEYCRWDTGSSESQILRRTPNGIVPLKYQNIRSHYMGNIEPRNDEQKMLFDLLQNNHVKVKLALGNFGTGKSFVMLAHAIDMVQRGKFEKIIFVRNNIQTKDSRDLGALPGDEVDKLFPYLMPIADHVGGVDGLNQMLDEGIIEPIHLGFLRGRDLKRCIIFCDECENLTRQHVQLILGRCAEGSQVWLAGDLKQTDHINFEKNSGLVALINRLKGHTLFGMVKLVNSERGDVPKLADLLD